MNERLDCSRTDELAAAYALGALVVAEERSVSAHLATCDQAHAEARSLIDAAAALPASLEPVAPSLALRDRLMATVATTAQEHRLAVAPVRERVAAPVEPRRAWWQLGALPAGLAAVGLAAAVGLGAWGVSVNAQLAERDAALRAVASADSIHAASGAVGSGWVIESGDETMFMAEDLAELPDGQLYEFWLIDAEGNAAAAGILTETDDVTLVTLERGIEDAAVFAVTVEAERVEQSANDPVMVATLDA